MKLTLTGHRKETPDVTSFLFKPERPLTWEAGQYLEYHLPHPEADDRGEIRWFTVSAAPFEGQARVTTRLAGEKGSSFKRALAALPEGATVEVKPPEGDFTMCDPDVHYIFIAGGIGITPYRAILKQAAHDGVQLNVDLLYANRDQSIVFKDELEALAAKNPQLRIRYIVEPQRIDKELLAELNRQDPKAVFCVSGPEPMVEAFDAMLKELGVPEERIKGDYFPGYARY